MPSDEVRKKIAVDAETWTAMSVLSRDSMKSLQELAEEAFRDLLKKHGRPVGLKDALRASARSAAANDDKPAKRKQRT